MNDSCIIRSKNYRGNLCAFYSKVGFPIHSMTRYLQSESLYHPYFQRGDIRLPSNDENMQLQSTRILKSPSAEIFKKLYSNHRLSSKCWNLPSTGTQFQRVQIEESTKSAFVQDTAKHVVILRMCLFLLFCNQALYEYINLILHVTKIVG